MTSNTINVLTTIEGANIGDELVATSRRNPAVVIRGRLADAGGVALLLETSDGARSAFLHDEWNFTATAPSTASFEALEVACPACASKPEDGTTAPSVEEIARVIYLHGLHVPEAPTTLPASCVAPECTWASDLKGIDLRDAHNAHVAEVIRALYAGHALDSLLDTRRKKIAELEAEVSRLTALAANKQTVIDEDRADAKRNRELHAAEVADLKHAVALEVDRTNDANQRADELAARVRKLEAEAALFEHVIEAADERIATLLRLDAADDDLDQAETALSEAEKLFDAATQADLETASALDQAKAKLREAAAEGKPCSCGSRNAYAMTPGQRLVHQADGPCFIQFVVDAEAMFGKFNPADLGQPFGKFEPGAAVWLNPQERDAFRKVTADLRNADRKAAAEVRDAAPEAGGIDA
ncbi:hypothetical protein ACFVJS_03930 [Nocardioides sp. NPDC057772]|uniref:hypothetical protein n=1 Tax=Nocardioides sp. NPDC057772 TaxID=3346245 RepID=UPI003670121C